MAPRKTPHDAHDKGKDYHFDGDKTWFTGKAVWLVALGTWAIAAAAWQMRTDIADMGKDLAALKRATWTREQMRQYNSEIGRVNDWKVKTPDVDEIAKQIP